MVTRVDPSYLTSNNNNRESKMAEDNSIPIAHRDRRLWLRSKRQIRIPSWLATARSRTRARDQEIEEEFAARDLTTEEVWYASTGCINKCLGCGLLDIIGDIEWRNHECPGLDLRDYAHRD
jgi:hypothetical protein